MTVAAIHISYHIQPLSSQHSKYRYLHSNERYMSLRFNGIYHYFCVKLEKFALSQATVYPIFVCGIGISVNVSPLFTVFTTSFSPDCLKVIVINSFSVSGDYSVKILSGLLLPCSLVSEQACKGNNIPNTNKNATKDFLIFLTLSFRLFFQL